MPEALLDPLVALGGWGLGALGLPLLLWTLCAFVLWHLDARLPLKRPLVRQRLLVAMLVALPLGLALRTAAPVAAPTPVAPLWSYFALGEITVTADAPALPGDEATPADEVLPPARPPGLLVAGGLTGLLLLAALAGLAGALVQHLRLWSWLHALPDASLDAGPVRALARQLSRRHVRLRIVDRPLSPFTCGWLRPLVVVPAALAADRDALRLALTHELAHVRNADALWHALGHFAVACVPWHPLARRLEAQAALRCEQAADAFVLGRYPTERRPYAHLLLRFGALPAPVAALSASVHHLNPRVHAMKHVLDLRARGLAPALLLACSLAFALSLQAQVPPPPPPAPIAPPAPETFVVVDTPPRLIGGLEAIQQNLDYPDEAQRAGVEGRVIVQFVVDEKGQVQDARVVRGVSEALDAAALRAVRQARFEPGTQRGQAVKVQMTLPVTFRLPGAPPAPPSPPSTPAPPPAPGDEVFVVVEQMPELVGGLSALAQQVRYPQEAKAAGVEGRVIVKFVVAKDGRVQHAEVVRGVGGGLDEEALRVVRAAEFTPGVQRGQAVNVRMTLPITFKLGAEKAAAGDADGLRLLGVQRVGDTITGRVIDGRTGRPLAGASVVVPGTRIGAATDIDGAFVLKGVNTGQAEVRVSFVGLETVTVPVEHTRALRATDVAEGYTLAPGVPNPFSNEQEVAFAVPTAGVAVLEVYNAIGQRVAVLFNGEAQAGQRYRATFSGADRESGVYFYRLTHDGKTMTQTGTLAR